MDRTFRLCSTTLFTLAFASLGARADVTADWTSHAVAATQQARQSPQDAARSLKLVKEAMRSAADPGSNGNGHTNGLGSKTERDDAAVAVAAFAVLETLYPDQREGLDAQLSVTFANIPETDAKAEGAAAGRRIATELLRAGR